MKQSNHHVVQIDGYRIAYDEQGAGSPVVVIHGISTSMIVPGHAEYFDASSAVAALQHVDDKYRAPLTMFYLEELSYKDIAEVLGLPIGTIMSRLARGKELLRRRLQELPPIQREQRLVLGNHNPSHFALSRA